MVNQYKDQERAKAIEMLPHLIRLTEVFSQSDLG